MERIALIDGVVHLVFDGWRCVPVATITEFLRMTPAERGEAFRLIRETEGKPLQ